MKVKSIQLHSGDTIEVVGGVTVVVGPNSAGKSTLLREVAERLGAHANVPEDQDTAQTKMVKSVLLDYEETAEEFVEKLKRTPYYLPLGHRLGSSDHDTLRPPRRSDFSPLPTNYLSQIWGSQSGLGQFQDFFVLSLGAAGRTELLADTSSYDSQIQFPRTPLQYLISDRRLEKHADQIIHDAFQKNIVLNRHAGPNVSLHVGKLPWRDRLYQTEETRTFFQSLPTVQEEGDGFKSFLGLALTIETGQAPLILIDEPEAFLHPPQARRFGKFLAAQQKKGVQVIVATHSQDILSGITSVQRTSRSVSVIRLTRDETGANRASQLKAEDVRTIYNDPLTKYYGLLDSLFASGVVVCEADSDCTFYSAVLDAAGSQAINGLDLHFAHCGGRGRIGKAISMMRKVGVPAACVVDIDILNDAGTFKSLVEAAGGDGAELLPMRDEIAAELDAITAGPLKSDVLDKIKEQFDRRSNVRVLPADFEAIKAIANVRSGWKQFKKHGVEAATPGTVSTLSSSSLVTFETLDSKLRRLGIFMVRVGELESFHPELAVAKTEWLDKALRRKSYTKSPLALKMLVEAGKYMEASAGTDQEITAA